MLFRGDTPLTPDERADYEIERTLFELQHEGFLLLKRMDPTGPVWNPTLRALRERDCPLGCFRS